MKSKKDGRDQKRRYHLKLSENRRIPLADLLMEETPTGSEAMEAQYLHLSVFVKYYASRIKHQTPSLLLRIYGRTPNYPLTESLLAALQDPQLPWLLAFWGVGLIGFHVHFVLVALSSPWSPSGWVGGWIFVLK